MKQKIILIIALTLTLTLEYCYGQIFDRFGLSIGTSYSTQVWDYKLISVNSDRDYKIGLLTFISAERDFGDTFSLRSELGYIQKGFKRQLEWKLGDGTSYEFDNDNVVLHDLALNLGLKVGPFNFDYSPYLFVGCRGDYLVSYKDIVFVEKESGKEFNIHGSDLDDFNKFNIGGLFGLGVDIRELFYFEIEYKPSFTKNLDDKGLSVVDKCWAVKLGLNINKMIELKSDT